ncbi:MAG: glucose 1-dehydrogenase [Lunatimonas sp.]|uniref:SDR family NAD(P)-dependent oxidoreductase n=1 Tax=Lunatimonas sp. TaxID=2060141 RepID=UPI00263B5DE9|nr:glucose 1-dehydrogenase [Lunatimonas sp.]MCC5939245.1 glucose 1-dehydrogenase [Lunatimonas sp.]
MDLNTLFSLQDKVAIITGSSKGIGFSIAHFFAAAGAKVVLNSRNQEHLNEAVATLRNRGYEVTGFAHHIGYQEQRKLLIEGTVKKYGQIDILVNNAAVSPIFAPIHEYEMGVMDKIIDVNLKAPYELSQLCFPHLKKSTTSAIINISSIGAISPERGLGLYSISKAALISMTKVFAKEWGDFNIRVNAICPGVIKTEFSKGLWSDEKIHEHIMKNLPLQRLGNEEEIAAMALFLASEASSYTTGAVFTSDGGYSI